MVEEGIFTTRVGINPFHPFRNRRKSRRVALLYGLHVNCPRENGVRGYKHKDIV
jgi:hypothetical protein